MTDENLKNCINKTPVQRKSAKVDVRFLPEEKEYLYSLANKANISVSEFLRRLVTGASLPSPSRLEAVKDIVKVNADLARLGNLLTLALDDNRTPKNKVERLIDGITNDRTRLEEILKSIKDYRRI